MSKLFIRGMVIFGLLLMTCSTASADKSAYVGGGLGNATWDLEPTPFGGPYELEDGIAIRMFAGVRQEYIGGEAELSISSHDWDTSNYNATHNAVHIVFSGVGYLPVSSVFELFGKIGFNIWSTTVDFQGGIYDGDDGIDMTYGFGLNVNVTEELTLRFEHQSLPGLGDGIDEGDVEQNTINLLFNF